MDIGTHLVTGLVISTAFDDPLAKGACIVASVLPDVVLWFPNLKRIQKDEMGRMVGMIREKEKGKLRKAVKMAQHKSRSQPHRDRVFHWYYWTHSFFTVGALFITAAWFGHQMGWAFAMGYLSHVLWDIPTHTGMWANRPLYPFSMKYIPGYKNWWLHTEMLVFMVAVWVILGTVYVSAQWNGFPTL